MPVNEVERVEVPGEGVEINNSVNYELPDTQEELTDLANNAPVIVEETKKGYKTTEFWITVISAFAVVFNGVPLPESKEGYVVAALAGLYAVARGLAKRGVPHVEPV